MKVVKYGESILKKKIKPVDFTAIENRLPDILKDMWDTCFALKGTGLAANQIGLDLRLAIIVITEKQKEKRFVLINPKVVEKSGRSFEQEGCLSVPGIYYRVKRFSKVKVAALNEKGLPVEINATGLFARVLQHEVDHLDGKLFIDKLPPLSKLRLKPIIKKLKSRWEKTDESKGKFYEGPIFSDT
jgi:peptide deformylase